MQSLEGYEILSQTIKLEKRQGIDKSQAKNDLNIRNKKLQILIKYS